MSVGRINSHVLDTRPNAVSAFPQSISFAYCRRARAPIDTTINGGSANGGAIVWWHSTTELSLQVAGTAIFILLRVDHVQCHVTPPHSSLLEKVLIPSTRQNNQNNKNNSIYMPYCVDKSLLIVCEPTSKSCPRDPSSRPVTAPKTHFSVQSKPNIQVYPRSLCF